MISIYDNIKQSMSLVQNYEKVYLEKNVAFSSTVAWQIFRNYCLGKQHLASDSWILYLNTLWLDFKITLRA